MGHYGSRLTFIGSKACLIFFLQVVLRQQIFWIKHSYFLNFDHSRILMKFYKILSRYKIFQLFCYFDKWKHVYPNSISPILFMTQWLIFLQFQNFDISFDTFWNETFDHVCTYQFCNILLLRCSSIFSPTFISLLAKRKQTSIFLSVGIFIKVVKL